MFRHKNCQFGPSMHQFWPSVAVPHLGPKARAEVRIARALRCFWGTSDQPSKNMALMEMSLTH
jgi:hypothetical protein